MSVLKPLELTVNLKPDFVCSDIVPGSLGDGVCPTCNQGPYFVKLADGGFKKVDVLKGPFFRYERRIFELYFDLRKKFFHCSNCGEDIIVLDYQVLLESLCSMLPPEYARKFSMKHMRLIACIQKG